MPRIVKINNVNILCFTPKEVDRLPNVHLGRNCNVITNNQLMKNKFLQQYVNRDTMGALDNYAQHENLRVYITPLENDLFDDLAVSVYKGEEVSAKEKFAIKIEKGKEGTYKFFKELYNKVAQAAQKLSE